MPDNPTQFAYPMRLDGDGDFLEVDQDSLPEVEQSVFTLMRTPLGARPLAPKIGVEDPTFTNVDTDALTATLEDQEDRAVVTVTIVTDDGTGEEQLQVDVALASDIENQPAGVL